MKIKDIRERASSYGIPGKIADGNDIFSVYEAARKAILRAREGKGPTLLECKTYRRGGHSRSDACKYRQKEEEKMWLEKDPIPQAKKKLIQLRVLTEESVRDIEEKVKKEIEEAIEYARRSPSPEPEDTLVNVFAGGEA